GDLAQEDDRVDHHSIADDAGALRVEDARGDELELELAVLGDDGVARVVAALAADDHVGPGGEVVDDLALALVAPLTADQDDDHRLLGTRFGSPRLQVVEAGVVAAELELDHARRAVAVFGHDQLCDARPLITLVVLRPIKKYDNVRVLFNGA